MKTTNKRKDLLDKKVDLEGQLKKINEQLDNPDNLFAGIESYTDMCEAFGEEELTIADFDFLPKETRKKTLATERIRQAERLFNGNWKTKWGNSNHYNYYPVFYNNRGGWSFTFSYYRCDGSSGQVAYFKDKKTSDFVGTLLLEEYKLTF